MCDSESNIIIWMGEGHGVTGISKQGGVDSVDIAERVGVNSGSW